MKLDTEFYKLPLQFDVKRMAEEVAQFSESDWRKHPQGYPGNTAISLIAVNGNAANDSPRGLMRATWYLERCPYIRQVLASFGAVLGRTRLMRIAGEGDASAHVDTNYYWIQRVRVHVPIITQAEVRYICNGKSVHMAAGETWIFNTWRMHNSINPTPQPRIHLVSDTVGSPFFWDLVSKAEQPFGANPSAQIPPRLISFEPGRAHDVQTESVNFPIVMTPEEQSFHIKWIMDECAKVEFASQAAIVKLAGILESFQGQWRALWAQHGTRSTGWPAYAQLLEQVQKSLEPLNNVLKLPNDMEAVEIVLQALVRPALNTDLAVEPSAAPVVSMAPIAPIIPIAPITPMGGMGSMGIMTPPAAARAQVPPTPQGPARFERPIFIVSAPRSGSSLLFETLMRAPGLFTIGGESHLVFERIVKLNPGFREYDSNRLTATDADPKTAQLVKEGFLATLRDRGNQRIPPGTRAIRMLEKTPKNALRIPFLNAIFPDALFIYLYRDPAENMSSILEAWKSGHFVTYPNLPEWPGLQWSLLLIPHWRQLRGKPVEEVAAAQWSCANQCIMDDLAQISATRVCSLSYTELMADPQAQMKKLCQFAGIEWDQDLRGQLPHSQHTLTPPDPEKWRKNAAALENVLKHAEPVAAKAKEMLARVVVFPNAASANNVQSPQEPAMPDAVPPQAQFPQAPQAPQENDPPPLRSVHTTSFPPLLNQLNMSLLVSTYQAGKLISVRTLDGGLNTHFTNFHSPMGLAGDGARMAVGTLHQVWEYRNQPDVGKKIEPIGKVDACYIPRQSHTTGDIRIHEIAWAGDELWIVNTRFSCLCTLDRIHSFVPRWRPPFITGYAPDDRCHLNGLAMVDNKPKYVTALGLTDESGGWRKNKANGGILMDVPSGEVMATGLSMPHSPRWYGNKLWLLESGHGRLSLVDEKTGKTTTVAVLPGFTRGMDFCGPYAFIGLSQVRETAIFSGIPITETQTERICGVWVVDLRNGQVVAFLKFEGAVQEIFGVLVLNGIRFPDVINDNDEILGNSFVLPDDALKLVQNRAPAT